MNVLEILNLESQNDSEVLRCDSDDSCNVSELTDSSELHDTTQSQTHHEPSNNSIISQDSNPHSEMEDPIVNLMCPEHCTNINCEHFNKVIDTNYENMLNCTNISVILDDKNDCINDSNDEYNDKAVDNGHHEIKLTKLGQKRGYTISQKITKTEGFIWSGQANYMTWWVRKILIDNISRSLNNDEHDLEIVPVEKQVTCTKCFMPLGQRLTISCGLCSSQRHKSCKPAQLWESCHNRCKPFRLTHLSNNKRHILEREDKKKPGSSFCYSNISNTITRSLKTCTAILHKEKLQTELEELPKLTKGDEEKANVLRHKIDTLKDLAATKIVINDIRTDLGHREVDGDGDALRLHQINKPLLSLDPQNDNLDSLHPMSRYQLIKPVIKSSAHDNEAKDVISDLINEIINDIRPSISVKKNEISTQTDDPVSARTKDMKRIKKNRSKDDHELKIEALEETINNQKVDIAVLTENNDAYKIAMEVQRKRIMELERELVKRKPNCKETELVHTSNAMSLFTKFILEQQGISEQMKQATQLLKETQEKISQGTTL